MSSTLESIKNEFNFQVDKFPLSGPDGMTTPWYGLFRSDTNKVVGRGSVTKRYVPHQTEDVLAIAEAATKVFNDNNLKVQCGFRDGHFVSFAPQDSYRRQVFGTKDNVFPRIVVRAGYDGSAFKASMGYYRDLCSNLHIPKATDIAVNVTIRHTSGLRKHMGELIQDFQLLESGWDGIAKQIQFMQQREVNLAQFLDAIYPKPEEEKDSKRALTVHKKRTESIIRRVINERNVSGRPTLDNGMMVSAWEAFNAVQGFVQHDATRKQGFTGEMDRIMLASRDPAVIAAERLALAV